MRIVGVLLHVFARRPRRRCIDAQVVLGFDLTSSTRKTATVAVEVWIRPWASVAGTRHAVTPDLYFRRE
jgi:hypothetical protein